MSRPTTARAGVVATQTSSHPATETPIAPSSSGSMPKRPVSRAPLSRPIAIPAIRTLIRAAAMPELTPVRWRSRSPTQKVRQNSTAMQQVTTPSASQNWCGRGESVEARRGGSPTRASDVGARSTSTTASTASGTPTATAPRQDRPSATEPPTASGARIPTVAATPLASVMAAGPASWWWAESTGLTALNEVEPPRPTSRTARTVHGRPGANTRASTPTSTPQVPSTSTPRRPIRRTAATDTAADSTAPTARAVPCRPATAREVPCSSRNSGTLGPNE